MCTAIKYNMYTWGWRLHEYISVKIRSDWRAFGVIFYFYFEDTQQNGCSTYLKMGRTYLV